MPEVLRYPADVAKFNKWLRFDVRGGRHVGRGAPDESQKPDNVVMSAALYLPTSALKSSMTVGYDTTEFSGLLVEAAAQSIETFMNMKVGVNAIEEGKAALALAGDAALKLASGFNAETAGEWLKSKAFESLGTQFEAATGQKANPRTDIIFTAQDYRVWTFEYILIPRTYQEAQTIEKIVNMFYFYMLPTYRGTNTAVGAKGAYMMGYPYEWTIGIFGNGSLDSSTELAHANKIGRSVLKNLTLDQAAGGKVAFVGKNGSQELFPLVTSLTLEFQEVVLLGRDQPDIIGGVPDGGDHRA